MQRLVLAILFVGLAVGAIALARRGVRATAPVQGGSGTRIDQPGFTMQRLAFFVLVALIFYVSVLGAA